VKLLELSVELHCARSYRGTRAHVRFDGLGEIFVVRAHGVLNELHLPRRKHFEKKGER